MLQKLSHHINSKFPFLKDRKLLIAISGGVDSVVLTHLLKELEFNISLAHCNFHLRDEESNIDAAFVKNLGKHLNLETFITSINLNPIGSIQLAARELRYKWFQELIKKQSLDFVLTAHHADDNLETFLINLTRGSGLDGFTGIPEKNGTIIRTLLPFSRNEILAFAKENNIKWREDASNASTKYVRNKFRHQVIPILKEINPNLLKTFAKTLENLQESQHIINDSVQNIYKDVVEQEDKILKIDIKKIQKFSNPKAYLYQLLKANNFTEWNDVYNLLSAQSGKQVFSKTHTLLKDRDFLILSKRDFSNAINMTFTIKENTSEITKPIHLKFEEVTEQSTQNKQVIYVDKKKLIFPLKLKKWQSGDYFHPLGMKGKKKLSKYFKDEKFSLLKKQNTWLLYNNNNQIIWVVGYRQDNRFRTKESSNNILKISI